MHRPASFLPRAGFLLLAVLMLVGIAGSQSE
jgi:hypothetical protein